VDYKILMDDIETFYKELVRVIAELEDEEVRMGIFLLMSEN